MVRPSDQIYFSLIGTDPEVADEAIPQLVAPDAIPQLEGNGFTFTEGPAVDANGDVYFTDISAASAHKWEYSSSAITLFRSNTGRANGQFVDAAGNVIACEIDNSRLTSTDPSTGLLTVLTDSFGGNPYNSPNDLWIDNMGGIYFTDPNYEGSANEDQGGRHVYYIAPDGSVTRVIDTLSNPNGIVGTPDGSTLYVVDSPRVYAYDINNGSVSNERLFTNTPGDGMCLDAQGNVYVCGGGAINVFNPLGQS